jgi:hypothetical protein
MGCRDDRVVGAAEDGLDQYAEGVNLVSLISGTDAFAAILFLGRKPDSGAQSR